MTTLKAMWAADDRKEARLSMRAEIKRLRAAIAWTLEVYPGKTREGGAVVEMTWDQFNTMRALAGKEW